MHTHAPAVEMRLPRYCWFLLLSTLEKGEAFVSPCARAPPAHQVPVRSLGYRSNPLIRPSTAAGVGQLRGGWSVRSSSLGVKKATADEEDVLPTFKIQVTVRRTTAFVVHLRRCTRFRGCQRVYQGLSTVVYAEVSVVESVSAHRRPLSLNLTFR